MPDKLTDNEIVKALECCCGGLTSDWCDKCPMNVTKECDKDLLALEKYALDLINRLQEEKEALINGQGTLQKYISDIQAENERLKAELEKSKVANSLFSMYVQIRDEVITEAKAKAYKECIEKVKEEITEALKSNYNTKAERIEKHNVGETDEFISYCDGKIDCLRGLDDFSDNLLKELVGE